MSAQSETADVPAEVAAELSELRLRVAAQDRLIAAMLEENQSIHELRRSTDELARIYHRFRGTPAFDAALAARARLKGLRSGGPQTTA
ncbi:hypothetical protein BH10ACT3_BH10ACT3_24420 [soil metagenome]